MNNYDVICIYINVYIVESDVPLGLQSIMLIFNDAF